MTSQCIQVNKRGWMLFLFLFFQSDDVTPFRGPAPARGLDPGLTKHEQRGEAQAEVCACI